MKRVLLLRHAKAVVLEAGMKDYDRVLSEKGEQGIALIGQYIEKNALIPDFVFCSPTQRTRQTLDLAEKQWSRTPLKTYKPLLYGGGISPYLDMIYTALASDDSIMIVGHNPDVQMTGLELLRDSFPEIWEKIEHKYATAGLLVLDFEIDVWSEIKYKTPVAAQFITPKILRGKKDSMQDSVV